MVASSICGISAGGKGKGERQWPAERHWTLLVDVERRWTSFFARSEGSTRGSGGGSAIDSSEVGGSALSP